MGLLSSKKKKDLEEEEPLVSSEEKYKPEESTPVETEKPTSNIQLVKDVELLKAQIEAIKEKDKLNEERLSRFSEQIGEIRAMALDTEKFVKSLETKAEKAITIVSEVEPEKLSSEVRKLQTLIEKQNNTLEKHKALIDGLTENLKEVNKVVKNIKGTESLIKMNEEIREELINIKKIEALTERNADKAENIMINLQKQFSELAKLPSDFENVQKSQQNLIKELDALKAKQDTLVEKRSFEPFKEELKNKIDQIHQLFSEISNVSNNLKNELKSVSSAHAKFDDILLRIKNNEKEQRKLYEENETLKEYITALDKKVSVFTRSSVISKDIPLDIENFMVRLHYVENVLNDIIDALSVRIKLNRNTMVNLSLLQIYEAIYNLNKSKNFEDIKTNMEHLRNAVFYLKNNNIYPQSLINLVLNSLENVKKSLNDPQITKLIEDYSFNF